MHSVHRGDVWKTTPGQTPPWADTCLGRHPPGQTPRGRQPARQIPSRQTPPGQTPLPQRWPLHPTGIHSCYIHILISCFGAKFCGQYRNFDSNIKVRLVYFQISDLVDSVTNLSWPEAVHYVRVLRDVSWYDKQATRNNHPVSENSLAFYCLVPYGSKAKEKTKVIQYCLQ